MNSFNAAEIASFRRAGWAGLAEGRRAHSTHQTTGATTMSKNKKQQDQALTLSPAVAKSIGLQVAVAKSIGLQVETVDRPSTGRGKAIPELTDYDREILDTLKTGKAKRVAVPEGSTPEAFARIVRSRIMANGNKGTVGLHRVLGAKTVTFWCTAPRVQKPRTRKPAAVPAGPAASERGAALDAERVA